jgi:hypothetical protein
VKTGTIAARSATATDRMDLDCLVLLTVQLLRTHSENGGGMSWKKLLPWPLLLAFGLALFPVAAQFKPSEVWTKLGSWQSVIYVILVSLFLLAAIRAVYFGVFAKRPEPVAAPASAHDIQLFQRINNVLNDGALTFLADHDWRVDAHVSQLEPTTTISYWHGPNYVFGDEVIQARWVILYDKIRRLTDVYGNNLTSSENDVNRMTAWHVGIPQNAQPPHALEEIEELNQAAADVYVEFGSFAPFVRQRLGL